MTNFDALADIYEIVLLFLGHKRLSMPAYITLDFEHLRSKDHNFVGEQAASPPGARTPPKKASSSCEPTFRHPSNLTGNPI